jgi:hypothetical protein
MDDPRPVEQFIERLKVRYGRNNDLLALIALIEMLRKDSMALEAVVADLLYDADGECISTRTISSEAISDHLC